MNPLTLLYEESSSFYDDKSSNRRIYFDYFRLSLKRVKSRRNEWLRTWKFHTCFARISKYKSITKKGRIWSNMISVHVERWGWQAAERERDSEKVRSVDSSLSCFLNRAKNIRAGPTFWSLISCIFLRRLAPLHTHVQRNSSAEGRDTRRKEKDRGKDRTKETRRWVTKKGKENEDRAERR